MSQKQELLIFVRNPEEGKVKTRIAETLGDAAALSLYRHLLHHTHQITKDLPYDKAVYYDEFIDTHDLWEPELYQKHQQVPGDLGHRLRCAFSTAFRSDYCAMVAIGSDCLALQPRHITEAFEKLSAYDVVLGPAADGGYYLIGMNEVQGNIFDNMPWSSDQLLHETIRKIELLDLRYFLLETLPDIDTEKDLQQYPELYRELRGA